MMENVEMDELAVILLMFANLWRDRNLAIADRRRPRSYWVHPIFQRERRRGVGEFHTLYHKLRTEITGYYKKSEAVQNATARKRNRKNWTPK